MGKNSAHFGWIGKELGEMQNEGEKKDREQKRMWEKGEGN